jgi:DNA repair protein RecO (recombination protein O)
MLVSGEGVILHYVKYGDNSLIVNIYTKEWGRQAYMVNVSRNRKSQNRSGILQPLFFVNLVAYQKDTREVQRIKEIKNQPVYQSIPFDVVKSSQIMFLAELLYKILREQESSPDTFNFIQNSLMYYDLTENPAANFHLWFLFRLTEFAGIMPDTTKTGFEGWFDMRKGAIVPFEPSHPFFMNKEATGALLKLASVQIGEIAQLRIPASLRYSLTTKLVEYYQLHFEHLGEIKSLKVLHELFS